MGKHLVTAARAEIYQFHLPIFSALYRIEFHLRKTPIGYNLLEPVLQLG